MLPKNAGKIVFLFLISFVVLFVLSVFDGQTNFRGWSLSSDLSRIDYFYTLMPFCGFFFMFLLVDWIESYFQTKLTRTVWFGVLLFALAVVAYYVSVFWLYCNLFSFEQNTFCSSQGAASTVSFLSAPTPINNVLVNVLSDIPVDFVSKFFSSILRNNFVGLFLSSPFIIFALAALFGWVSRLIIFKLEPEQG